MRSGSFLATFSVCWICIYKSFLGSKNIKISKLMISGGKESELKHENIFKGANDKLWQIEYLCSFNNTKRS